MRILVIGEAEKEAASRLVAFAERPENRYKPGPRDDTGPGDKVPGDDPNYRLQLWDYRCVFTITETPQGVFRHLSISVPAKDKLPHPGAIEQIAPLFGIEGTVEEWARKGHVAPHENENCIVVVAPYKDEYCQERETITGLQCKLKAGHETNPVDGGHVFPLTDAFLEALDRGDIIIGRPPKKAKPS
jgi:hypothetical protein